MYSMYMKTPLYASSARVIVQANAETMNTLKAMVNEPVILEKVAAELNINSICRCIKWTNKYRKCTRLSDYENKCSGY